MVRRLTSLRPWQYLVVAVVAVVMVAGGAAAAARLGDNNGPLPEGAQLVAAAPGDVVLSVSATGSVVYPGKETLRFSAAGTVEEVLVAAGARVQRGQPLARLDGVAVASLEQAVAQAELALASARAELETVAGGALLQQRLLELRDAELALEAAEAALEAAQAQRASQAGDLERAVADAEAAYRNAFLRYLGYRPTNAELQEPPAQVLARLDADLDLLFHPVQGPAAAREAMASGGTAYNPYVVYAWVVLTPPNLGASQVSVPSAQDVRNALDATWEALEAARRAARRGVVDLDRAVVTAERAVRQARDALARAQANAADAEKGVAALEVRLKQQAVALAQANLDAAIAKLEQAVLTAPHDGVVTEVLVAAGDQVTPTTRAMTLVDPGRVEVTATLDELDIVRVREGQEVRITLDAMSGMALQGQVTRVSPVAQVTQGVVSYQVTVELATAASGPGGRPRSTLGGSRPGGLGPGAGGLAGGVTPPLDLTALLREGMTATVEIIQQAAREVLTVPARALQVGQEGPYVEVLADGRVERRTVAVGLSDGLRVEVREGLEEGEQVVVRQTARTGNTGQVGAGFGGVVVRPGGGGGIIQRPAGGPGGR